MTHRFPIKEIARQAGLGPATVDRVLNNRAHVSPQTKARVNAAILELKAQEAQLSARGRRLYFDFIVEAPSRFSREVQNAAQQVVPQIGTAVCRSRFVMQEIMEEEDVVAALLRILKRGSHGVCLKARDTPKIRAAVDQLWGAGIPVVTLVTDILDTDRIAYVGLDNAGAGATAAFLVAQVIGAQEGQVLSMCSHAGFLGEEERERAFLQALAVRCPKLQVVSVKGGNGVALQTSRVLAQAMGRITHLRAVYSMGGGNNSILRVLEEHGKRPRIFVAHDLDQENRALITRERLDYILHHDLRRDISQAFSAFLAHHKLGPWPAAPLISTVQVITPANVPPLLRG